jgi:hypothetical protein
MRLSVLIPVLLIASTLYAKIPPAVQGTFVGTENVDCLMVKQSTAAVLWSLGTDVKGLPVAIPVPLDRFFPDRKTFAAIKVYRVLVGDKTYETVPNSKNPLVSVAPGETVTVSVTPTNLWVYVGKKRYKYLILRAAK